MPRDASLARQSRRMSLVETITNVIVGYGLALATQSLVFPWFGLHPAIEANLLIGGVFTITSLARGYFVRRVFETLRLRRALE
jgi:hypothetical protein